MNSRYFCFPPVSLFVVFLSVATLSNFVPVQAVNSPVITSHEESSVPWQSWSPEVFKKAKEEHKYIVLDLEAVWCHWCHVMEEKTYRNSSIIKLIKEQYIPVRVDQDSRPDLSNRYEDYGWPATIIFSPEGKELQKLSGYIPPKEFISILLKPELSRDGTSENIDEELKQTKLSLVSSGRVSVALRHKLEEKHKAGYDTENGGWGFGHKFLHADTVEYAINRARSGDTEEEKRAKESLKLGQQLLDNAWGGFYQYSTDNDWVHPHFEKIVATQADNLKIYSLAYSLWKEAAYLHAAEEVARYLNNFLRSPEGAFYTSQDADLVQGRHSIKYFTLNDQARRKQGIPRIDKHIYSRENGWAIAAFTALYQASGKQQYLNEAEQAADWIIQNRSLPGGGLRHDASQTVGPFLGDTLYMGKAFLALYSATGKRKWYQKAEDAADFIRAHFYKTAPANASSHDSNVSTEPANTTGADANQAGAIESGAADEGGIMTASFAMSEVSGSDFDITCNYSENIDVARFANLIYRYSGNENDKALAASALRYLSRPQIALSQSIFVGGVLMADDEISCDPVHFTIVGGKKDDTAKNLFAVSQLFPSFYKRLEWFDPLEGKLPNQDVEFPQLDYAAAFVCGRNSCSKPIRYTDKLLETISNLCHHNPANSTN